jgi:hypothetical protein
LWIHDSSCGWLQIKPQLEKLLKLAPDGLAKEIDLTEKLMELFIKYQIPSDLLAFEEGPEEVCKLGLLFV